MYSPAEFAVSDAPTLHAFMDQYPFGQLVCGGARVEVQHLPWLRLPEDGSGQTVLTAHVARVNPIWQRLPHADAVAVFTGPNAYISPSWYPEKARTGKVVPTWNYTAVQARGTASAITDPEWLLEHLQQLTQRAEFARPQPWAVDDAPATFIHKLAQAIVGIRFEVHELEGIFKASQNKRADDAQGALAGLQASGNEADVAMAEWMAQVGAGVHRPG